MSQYLSEVILGRLHEWCMESPTDSKGGNLHSPLANGLGLHLCQHCLMARHHPTLHRIACILMSNHTLAVCKAAAALRPWAVLLSWAGFVCRPYLMWRLHDSY